MEDHRGATLQVCSQSDAASTLLVGSKSQQIFFCSLFQCNYLFNLIFGAIVARVVVPLDSSFLLRKSFEVFGVLLKTYLSHETLTPVEILRL